MLRSLSVNFRSLILIHFDILPSLKTRESHGTAPLSWDIRVCSLPLVPAVGIRWRSPEGRLQTVSTSRYSYRRWIVEELSDSSRGNETGGLVRTPEITDFWGRPKARAFSLLFISIGHFDRHSSKAEPAMGSSLESPYHVPVER